MKSIAKTNLTVSNLKDYQKIGGMGNHFIIQFFGNYYNAINDNYRMRHYEIKTDDDETIAICRTWQTGENSCDIEYLESKPDSQYHFAGQTILASIAKEELKRNCEKLTVLSPIASAYSFYKKACGFRYNDDFLEMNKYELQDFIKRTEQKTKHKLEEIKNPIE